MGLPLNPELLTGIAIPVVIVAVGWGMHRMRRNLAQHE
jgi:uncharacterized membrane-anchored protein